MPRDPKPKTAGVVALSSVVAVFMIAQQIASKAVRDGFFLSEFEVTALPIATLGAAVVSFGAALYVGKFIGTFSPGAAVPVLFAANGALFLAESALAATMPRLVAGGLYLHTAAFGGAVVSGFWSVMNERFDPYTAKKVMGRIAGGATFGGVLGGALTWIFADVAPRWLMAGFGASSMVCAVGIGLIARGGREKRPERERTALLAGVSVLAKNVYPRTIGIVVFLGALMTGTMDYVFKSGAVEATGGGSLVGFFAIFYTVVGVVTFAVQALGSRRILAWLGVVPTVGMLPAAAAALVGVALAVPGLFTLVLLRGGAMVVENSLYRSGYELLYTVVPRDQKRSAKVIVDLGCDRLGTAAASGIVLLIVATASLSVSRTLLITSLVSSLAVIGALVTVRREYVASLASKLRRALVSTEADSTNDTRRLASTFVAGVDLWASDGSNGDASSSAEATRSVGGSRGTSSLSRADLLARIERRGPRATPATLPVRRPVSHVSERLLETPLRQQLREESPDVDRLRQSSPALIGQLGDILLSRRESVAVRLRAVELLAHAPSQRSAATLFEALSSSELRLRRASALALLRNCTDAPHLRPPRRRLTELAAKELRRPSRSLGARSPFENTSPFREDARGNELAPSLEVAFLLLAVAGNTSELLLALRAITSEDRVQRGTGLEYLDNLLPGKLRGRLLALAEHPELTKADQRLPTSVVEELASKLRAGTMNIRELRRSYREAKRAHYDR